MSRRDFKPIDLGDWRPVGKIKLPGGHVALAFDRPADTGGFLRCIVGHEPEGWHLSISHNFAIIDPTTGGPIAGRLPVWEEVKEARYRFLPDDLVMAQVMPPKSDS